MYTVYLHFSRPRPMDGKGCHRVHTLPKVRVCIWYAYASSTSSVLIFTLLPSRCQFSVLWVVMYHSYTHKPWVLAECFSLFTSFSTCTPSWLILCDAFDSILVPQALKFLQSLPKFDRAFRGRSERSSMCNNATSAIPTNFRNSSNVYGKILGEKIHCIKLYHETMRFWYWFCMLLICCSLDFVWLLQEFLVVGGVTFGHPWYLA